MHGVGKLEELQNINKTPLFLTWSSDRYGKKCNFAILSLYELEQFCNDHTTMPRGKPC
jgi:hypothetical protein